MKMSALNVATLFCVALSAVAGCAAPAERVVFTAAGRRASVSEVDGDPWRLLPGGAVAWGYVKARDLARASFGAATNQLLAENLPFSQGEGIDLERDVDELVFGVYATAGVEVAAVARGRFQSERVAQAIARNPKARSGSAIVTNDFAGKKVFVADGWAMAVATEATLVFGTEVGVRRVLERIEESRLTRSLPAWYEQMLLQKEASLVLGADLDAQPVPSVMRTKVTFLQGLRAARLLGNFAEPGLNLAGTLTYDTPASAGKAAAGLQEQADTLRRADLLLAVLKISRPLRRFETQATGKDTQVAAEIDGRAIALALTQGDTFFSQMASPESP